MIIGLILDIVGAFVIAWPDIPKASQYLRSGRLRLGKHRLESQFPFMESMTGHKEIVDEVKDFHRKIKGDYDYSFDNFHKYTIGNLDESLPLTIHEDRIVTPPDDDGTRLQLGEFPYSAIEPFIETNIREQETRVRTVGFLLLAGGFILQLIGQFI